MDYRRMGRSGLKVSEICLGTMTFGHGTDAAGAEQIVGAALEAGVMFFDTANGYNDGVSETMLGRALGKRRREAIIASKVFNPMGPGPNDSGMSRSHIMQAVEDSLRRLGTDYLDLYYIHHVDVQTPLEEMLRAFDDLVRQGKVRYTGCSNYETWRLMEAVWISDSKNLTRFEAYQPQYSLVVRDIEEELVPACALKGLGVVVWSPLAGGYLAGKYKPGQTSVAGTRSAENWAFPTRFFHPDREAILGELLAVAQELGRSPRAGRGALGSGPAASRQRHHWRPHGRPAPRYARRSRLAAARGRAPAARQDLRVAPPLSTGDGGAHARAAQPSDPDSPQAGLTSIAVGASTAYLCRVSACRYSRRGYNVRTWISRDVTCRSRSKASS